MNFTRFIRVALAFAALFLLGLAEARAEGMKGKLGIGGFGGMGVPLGTKTLRDRGDVGADVGGTIRYGLDRNWAVGASYENIYLSHGIRREPLTLSALYYHDTTKRWTPVGEFGVGSAASTSGGPFTNFSMKAGIGAELVLAKNLTIGPQLNFHFISDTGKAPYQSYIMTPSVIAMLYFGGDDKAAPQAETATLAPMLPSFAVNPSAAALGPNQTRQFQAEISGRPNNLVRWSISPPLGTISDAGTYQAPETVAFAESVLVTATSSADPSKSATAVVQLKPPVTAPKTISIRLEVLFDTGKNTIKPAYHDPIKKVAEFLKSYPSTSAKIEGHSDNTGSAAYNRKLSKYRAENVRKYLIEKFGIEASRLTAYGYGPDQPIANNNTPQGRAQNRRVIAVVKTTVPS